MASLVGRSRSGLIRRFSLSAPDRQWPGRRRNHGSGRDAHDDGAVDRLARGSLIAVLVGQWLGVLFVDAPVTVPDFLLCLLAGLVLRNVGDSIGLRLHGAATELVGSVCLSLFLAWTMMALDFGAVFGMAGPLLISSPHRWCSLCFGLPW